MLQPETDVNATCHFIITNDTLDTTGIVPTVTQPGTLNVLCPIPLLSMLDDKLRVGLELLISGIMTPIKSNQIFVAVKRETRKDQTFRYKLNEEGSLQFLANWKPADLTISGTELFTLIQKDLQIELMQFTEKGIGRNIGYVSQF